MKKQTTTIANLAMLLVMAAPLGADHKPGHSPPGGKGGGDSSNSAIPVSVTFPDLPDHRIGSDLGGAYRDSKKNKLRVEIDGAGHLTLDTNTTNKTGVGRSLFADFSNGPGPVPVTIAGVEPCNIADLVSTLDLDTAGIPHDAILRIGDFQPDVDLRVMRVGDPPRDDVNARVSFFVHAPDQQQECPLVIRWDPFSHERSCTEFGSSFVTVSCIAESAGECDTWFIDATHQDANGNGQVDLGERSMACVELSGGGGGPYEFYSMPFTATVTAD